MFYEGHFTEAPRIMPLFVSSLHKKSGVVSCEMGDPALYVCDVGNSDQAQSEGRLFLTQTAQSVMVQ